MLQTPTNDRKTKTEARSKTAEHLLEQEQPTYLPGWIGSRQSNSFQEHNNQRALQKTYGNQAMLRMMDKSPAQIPVTASPLSQGGILQRKCACGNAAGSSGTCAECQDKGGMALPGNIQTKLTINQPGDRYEQEADQVAEQVLAAPTNSIISGAPPRIQRFTGQTTGQADMAAPASVDHVLSSPGRPLDPSLQQDMEQRFGRDFSSVRVHTGASAERSAQEVNANAYTVGHNIVFGARQFAPESVVGKRLLAHELVHTIQQQISSGDYTPSALQDAEPSTRLKKEDDQAADATVLGSLVSVKAVTEKGMLHRQEYSGPNVGPPVRELPQPSMLIVGKDKERDLVFKVQNPHLPIVRSTPDLPVDLRKLPDKIKDVVKEASDPNSSANKDLTCSAFKGFRAGGSSYKGQCCQENFQSKESCCPPNRIGFNQPFPRCCKANEKLKNGTCVIKKMESGEPDLTLPSPEPLPMQDGLEQTLPEGEEYA